MSVTHTAPETVEQRLRAWIDELCDDPPLIDQLSVDDLGTDCGRASLLRAALRQRLDKSPAVIRADLERQLRDEDLLAGWRLRRMSGDLSEIDFRSIHVVDRARAEGGDRRYRREAREAA